MLYCLCALQRLFNEFKILVNLSSEFLPCLTEPLISVLGALFPLPSLLLEGQLLHRVIRLTGCLASFLLLSSVITDGTLVLGLSVLLVPIEQLLLLVVVARVAKRDFGSSRRGEERGELRHARCGEAIENLRSIERLS